MQQTSQVLNERTYYDKVKPYLNVLLLPLKQLPPSQQRKQKPVDQLLDHFQEINLSEKDIFSIKKSKKGSKKNKKSKERQIISKTKQMSKSQQVSPKEISKAVEQKNLNISEQRRLKLEQMKKKEQERRQRIQLSEELGTKLIEEDEQPEKADFEDENDSMKIAQMKIRISGRMTTFYKRTGLKYTDHFTKYLLPYLQKSREMSQSSRKYTDQLKQSRENDNHFKFYKPGSFQSQDRAGFFEKQYYNDRNQIIMNESARGKIVNCEFHSPKSADQSTRSIKQQQVLDLMGNCLNMKKILNKLDFRFKYNLKKQNVGYNELYKQYESTQQKTFMEKQMLHEKNIERLISGQ